MAGRFIINLACSLYPQNTMRAKADRCSIFSIANIWRRMDTSFYASSVPMLGNSWSISSTHMTCAGGVLVNLSRPRLFTISIKCAVRNGFVPMKLTNWRRRLERLSTSISSFLRRARRLPHPGLYLRIPLLRYPNPTSIRLGHRLKKRGRPLIRLFSVLSPTHPRMNNNRRKSNGEHLILLRSRNMKCDRVLVHCHSLSKQNHCSRCPACVVGMEQRRTDAFNMPLFMTKERMRPKISSKQHCSLHARFSLSWYLFSLGCIYYVADVQGRCMCYFRKELFTFFFPCIFYICV